jgi:hypothetical protein
VHEIRGISPLLRDVGYANLDVNPPIEQQS